MTDEQTATHTPGPWHLTAPGMQVPYDPSKTNHCFVRGGDQFVCDVGYTGDQPGPGWSCDGTGYANARLIAAAPDLLAACDAYLNAMEKYGHPDKTDRLMRAAIAKAKGPMP